jgi:hypothetical protein
MSDGEGAVFRDGEPPEPDDRDDLDDLEGWAAWARQRLHDHEREAADRTTELVRLRADVRNLKKQVDAYETVIRSKSRLTAYEPGRRVYLVNAGNLEATILLTVIDRGGLVHYRAGWWNSGRWQEAVLHESEVEVELPLGVPSPAPERRRP